MFALMVVATKGNRTKKFTQIAWDLMGKNKAGWVQNADQTVTNEIPQKPNTGEKSKDDVPPPPSKEKTQKQKDDFMLLLSDIGKNAIKDYFDGVKVSYKPNAKEAVLKLQLAEYLEYDEAKLKEALS